MGKLGSWLFPVILDCERNSDGHFACLHPLSLQKQFVHHLSCALVGPFIAHLLTTLTMTPSSEVAGLGGA